ncbi:MULTISPECIES: hypothetical protein [unclassified Luteococcus]|uniref:hypothetical protein n=1 Tax=unclassified Luteococcus TaxID=2639923 RepID=UPI00313C580B
MNPVVHHLLEVLVVAGFGLLAVAAGGPLVRALFRRADRKRPTPDGADHQTPGVLAAATQLPGGSWIGRLERLAIYAGLVAHYPEAIAICLAVKGLARYPELKATTSGAAERFIIGTFVSVLLACACAGLEHWVNGLF